MIVHLGRLRDKSRKVLEVSEVGDVVDGKIELFPLFLFEEEGEEGGVVKGELRATGLKLRAMGKCQRAGVKI